MTTFIELKDYATDRVVVINKDAIISVSHHPYLAGAVVKLLYNSEFHIAESVEEIIAEINGVNNA